VVADISHKRANNPAHEFVAALFYAAGRVMRDVSPTIYGARPGPIFSGRLILGFRGGQTGESVSVAALPHETKKWNDLRPDSKLKDLFGESPALIGLGRNSRAKNFNKKLRNRSHPITCSTFGA